MKLKMTMGVKTSKFWNKVTCLLLAISLVVGSVIVSEEAAAAEYKQREWLKRPNE